jgi:serine/threonine protein kinase
MVAKEDVLFLDYENYCTTRWTDRLTAQPYAASLDSAPVDVYFRQRFGQNATLQEDRQKTEETSREARLLLDFRHPYILQLLGMTVTAEGAALIMERSACSLERLLHDRPLDPLFVVRIMAQVAAALDYLHKRGLIYNALVPGNVVLTGYVVNQSSMPLAKLSNFSQCRSDRLVGAARSKDIADFATLLHMLMSNESEKMVSAATDPLSLAELSFSRHAAASLIRDAWGGSLSAAELVKRLHLCEIHISYERNNQEE